MTSRLEWTDPAQMQTRQPHSTILPKLNAHALLPVPALWHISAQQSIWASIIDNPLAQKSPTHLYRSACVELAPRASQSPARRSSTGLGHNE